MTRDVCLCGHLEVSHRGDDGECSSPCCDCGGFVSEDELEQEAA